MLLSPARHAVVHAKHGETVDVGAFKSGKNTNAKSGIQHQQKRGDQLRHQGTLRHLPLLVAGVVLLFVLACRGNTRQQHDEDNEDRQRHVQHKLGEVGNGEGA